MLITGDSGVGKDLLAGIIHEASHRRQTGAFVKINCGAIPDQLLESELFGYEAGAFTGAKREGKIGFFEIADKGTIFLNEIGEVPLNLQVKMLSVIQDHKVVRVGGTYTKDVDVGIIAATNRNLAREICLGIFGTIFTIVSMSSMEIPPLKKRRDDIPFLLTHYLDVFNRKYGLNKTLAE